MRLRIPILSLLAALLLTLAAPAKASCPCRYRHYHTGYSYYRSARSAWNKTDVEPDEAQVYLADTSAPRMTMTASRECFGCRRVLID